jgi:hypothetical protein
VANELRNMGGVGMNTRYDVINDGEIVGSIARHGSSAVRVYGHYQVKLAGFNSFDEAKRAALALEFPTKRKLYEEICIRVEANRNASIEKSCGPRLARLARDLVAGSNSARDEMAGLTESMAKLAADRLHSTRDPARKMGWKIEYLDGEPVKWAEDCEFPEPPGE